MKKLEEGYVIVDLGNRGKRYIQKVWGTEEEALKELGDLLKYSSEEWRKRIGVREYKKRRAEAAFIKGKEVEGEPFKASVLNMIKESSKVGARNLVREEAGNSIMGYVKNSVGVFVSNSVFIAIWKMARGN